MAFYDGYISAIERQLSFTNPADYNFKSDSDYTWVLEHSSVDQGNNYLKEIKQKYGFLYKIHKQLLIELCKMNDMYGKTVKHHFHDFTECSPSNLRYIFHSLLILDYAAENNLNGIDFIEIGGGYGGLCFFLYKMASLFNITINSYSIFDLPQALQLQERYLNALHIGNINYCNLNNPKNLKTNSFLISNYAFSEITHELQELYIQRVINPYTTYGFLAWNVIDLYDFVKNSKIEKEREYPLTGGNNYYVRFKPL
jgi:hypothetical protein